MNNHKLRIERNRKFYTCDSAIVKNRLKRKGSFTKVLEHKLIDNSRGDLRNMESIFWTGKTNKPETGFLEEGC